MHQDGSESPKPQDTPHLHTPGASTHSDPSPGYLVVKLKEGEGVLIDDQVEVRLTSSRTGRADVAVRAPRGKRIRRLPIDPP